MDKERVDAIAELRRRTGSPIHTCREALDRANGDLETASKLLTETVIDAWDPDERRRFWDQFKPPRPDESK